MWRPSLAKVGHPMTSARALRPWRQGGQVFSQALQPAIPRVWDMPIDELGYPGMRDLRACGYLSPIPAMGAQGFTDLLIK
jgi:hypothetical protein